MKRKILYIMLFIGILAPFIAYAARTQSDWLLDPTGSYISPAQAPVNVLIQGPNRYLNFGTFSGFSGYGIRDNGGTMEFKNNAGTWQSIGTGSGGGANYWTLLGSDAYLNVGNDAQAPYFVATSTHASSFPYASTTAITATTASTTNLVISGISGTQCLHTISGIVSGTGVDCGSGSGTNYLTNLGITTSLNTGSILAAGIFNATATPSQFYDNGTPVITSSTTIQEYCFGASACNPNASQVGSAGDIVAIGDSALASMNSSSFENIALGLLSLASVTSGNRNVGIGDRTLVSLTTGDSNMAIGLGAGQNIKTSSEFNMCIGAGTCSGNGTYSSNVAVGSSALGGTGGSNTAIGYRTLQSSTLGTLNVAIGNDAGQFPNAAGNGALTTGSNDTFVGAGSGFTSNSTQYNNAGAFGSNAQVGCSNCIVLGATGANAVNVGIGTTTPWRTLSVAGLSDLGINALAGYFTATTTTASQFPYASTTAITATTASTTNLVISGISGTQCLHEIQGIVSGTGSDCGSGGGGVSSVTGTWPILSSGGTTPNITWGGLASSSPIIVGQNIYATGPNTYAGEATGTVAAGTGIIVSGTPYALNTGTTITNTGVISNSCPGGFLSCSGTNPSTFTLGTLGVPNGGTGQTAFTQGQILLGNTAGPLYNDAALAAATSSGIEQLNIGQPSGSFDKGQIGLSYLGSVTDGRIILTPAGGTSGTKTITIPNITGTLTTGNPATNMFTYYAPDGSIQGSSTPTVSGITATGTDAMGVINSFAGNLTIGNAVPLQMNGFGSGLYQFQISSSSNDVVGGNIYNTSRGTQAVSAFFLDGANTPTTGTGLAATYYGGLALAGPNFNGTPLGIGALTPNALALYVTDGKLILGSATSTGEIDMYTGAGSFAGGVPDAVLTSGGNFGIASSSPWRRLSVNGSSDLGNNALAGNFTATTTTASSFPYASTTAITSTTASTTNLILGNLGTPAGSFLAVNTVGKVIATTTPSGSGSGTVTSVGLSLPTGFTVTNSPVTTTGTLTGTLGTGYSVKELPSWTVGAAGADYTTIQAALTQCGAVGGGQIYLVDPSYAQGTTGLTWRGSNCAIYGRSAGTTTISFTGATTLFKTNSAVGDYTHDELHNILITGDSNASGVAIDWSDMTHGIVDNVQTSGVGRSLKLNDTQNITFYNTFSNLDFNNNITWCIDASSTNPVNDNLFTNIFCGGGANSGGVQLNNANGNIFKNISPEPSSVTGTVGLKLFDNKLATNNGVFNNRFENWYIEANGTGISIATSINASGGGIQRNQFVNMSIEANTTDYSVTPTAASLNTFQDSYDSNFGDPITTLQGPVGISTSTEMQSIGTTPYAFFGISADTSKATNEFVVANSTNRTDMRVDASGHVFIPNTTTNGAAQTGTVCYTAAGELVRDTAVCAVSALKFKKDVQPLDVGLDDLMKINPVSYYKKDPLDESDSHRQMGVIADQVASISPALNEMLVTYDSDGAIHGFRYDQYTALLTKSIQQLDVKVEAIKSGGAAAARSAEENWQWIAIGLLGIWNIVLTIKKRK